jgi:tetratricopeptide (TPR) repeat protein
MIHTATQELPGVSVRCRRRSWVPLAATALAASCAAASIDTVDTRVLLDSSNVLLVHQEYRAARQVLDRVLLQDPYSAEALYQILAVAQTEIGLDYESSEVHGESVIQLADSVAQRIEALLPSRSGTDSLWCLFYLASAWGAKGVVYSKTGNWMQAVRYGLRANGILKDILSLDPSFLPAYLGRGVFDYYVGRSLRWVPFAGSREQQGLDKIEEATRAPFPFDVGAKYSLCWILIDHDQYDRVDSLCGEVLRQIPGNTMFLKVGACAAWWGKRSERAIYRAKRLVEESLHREPVNWSDVLTGYRVLAESYMELGKVREARDVARKAMALEVPSPYKRMEYVREHTEYLRKLGDKGG